MRTMWRRVVLPVLFAGVAAAFVYAFLTSWNPPARRYPVRGVDVSHHQGEIDWRAVAADGIRFAWIKATEGGDFTDRRFAANWRGAAEAGIARGAYHFFTLCRPGADQAAHFIRTVPREEGALPPAVDLEFTGNCADKTRWLDAPAELAVFLAAVEAHYGRKAVLYVRRDFYRAYLAGRTLENPLWLQRFLLEPAYAGRPWTVWQYHAFGRVKGINGPADRNVFRGSREEFAAWLRQPNSPASDKIIMPKITSTTTR